MQVPEPSWQQWNFHWESHKGLELLKPFGYSAGIKYVYTSATEVASKKSKSKSIGLILIWVSTNCNLKIIINNILQNWNDHLDADSYSSNGIITAKASHQNMVWVPSGRRIVLGCKLSAWLSEFFLKPRHSFPGGGQADLTANAATFSVTENKSGKLLIG